MIYLGIDPGYSGAIAVVADGFANVWDTPVRDGEYDLPAMVSTIKSASSSYGAHVFGQWDGKVLATLEGGRIVPNTVKGRPDWRGQSAKTTAAQWRGIGIWEGILATLGIEYVIAPPATWKRAMGVTAEKRTSIRLARELFPSAAHLIYRAKDEGRAEALLLAQWGRRRPVRMAL